MRTWRGDSEAAAISLFTTAWAPGSGCQHESRGARERSMRSRQAEPAPVDQRVAGKFINQRRARRRPRDDRADGAERSAWLQARASGRSAGVGSRSDKSEALSAGSRLLRGRAPVANGCVIRPVDRLSAFHCPRREPDAADGAQRLRPRAGRALVNSLASCSRRRLPVV